MNDCRFGVPPVNYPDPDPDSARRGGSSSQSVEDGLFYYNYFLFLPLAVCCC